MTSRRTFVRGLATLVLGLVSVTMAGSGAASGAGPERVLIRLADAGGTRASLLASAIRTEPNLQARHAAVVRGLRSIHERSMGAARSTLEAAESAGALRRIDDLWLVNAVVAEVDPAWIARLSADPSIAEIVPDRRLTLGEARAGGGRVATPPPSAPVEELNRIHVPEVWAQGNIGQGAIVANVDTGVNGDDETLTARWRGRFAGSDQSWYAPVELTVFPNDDDTALSSGHGTATMGILTGGDGTFGVAYGATWMAGDLFTSAGRDAEGWVSTAIKLLEWMADPDGDPSTDSDVPDVVSNSYGLSDLDPATNKIRCDRIFDAALDGLEAAGAIVVWSAGNFGTQGVTSPANRADSPVNAFAVGGVDQQNDPFGSGGSGSGRGPSACGGSFATKPDIVAPGVRVTSRNRFNMTSSGFTGTSFSTPMVGGVLALMRSKNPEITPETAKSILLQTAIDLGAPGDDNDTGSGLVNAAAALARVERPTHPLARLVGYRATGDASGKLDPTGIEDALVLRPGGSVSIVPVLTNHGPALPSTTATMSSPTPGVTASTSAIALEAVATGGTFGTVGSQSFTVDVDGSVAPGTPIELVLTVQGATIGPFRLILQAGDPVPGDFATHDQGQIRLTVTDFGGLGYYTGRHIGGFVLQGQGFRFPPSSPNWLFHAGFMAGTSPSRLSDDVPYGEDTQASTDWLPRFGFPISVGTEAGGQRILVGYDDRKALNPLGLDVDQKSFAFDDSDADDFVILQYVLTNRGSAGLAGLRVGLFADWDLPGGNGQPGETAGWDPAHRLGFVEGTLSDQPALGVVWLDATPTAQLSYAALSATDALSDSRGNPVAGLAPAEAGRAFGGEFSDLEKWDALTSGQTDVTIGTPQDVWQIIGAGPLSIAVGERDTVAVALVAAADRAGLTAVADRARDAYFRRILGTEPPTPGEPPDAVALEQNFPNPFRVDQATTIRFGIPEPSGSGQASVDIAVYDVLGQRVRTLRQGSVVAGEQAVTWDGRDESGRRAPAGVYLVRLETQGTTRAIRLLLLP